MTKKYQGEGNVIDVTLAAAATSGVPIVVGTLLGVPLTDGEIGDVIAVAISGVHNIPKVDAAVITQGETIVWDVSAAAGAGEADDAAATPATGDLSLGCVAMESKIATTGEDIAVKLNVAVNTVA